ncbi:hypothetical protein D3C80_1827560 [compost metagenome]
MTNQDQVGQVQRIDQFSKIVGILVHVIAVECLIRATMAAAIMGNDPEAILAEKQHLLVPGI